MVLNTILLILLSIVAKCNILQIQQNLIHDESYSILEIEITLDQKQNFSVSYYNNQTHYFEMIQCTNQEMCQCESSKFSNFYCFEYNNEYHFKLQKGPYLYGDKILENKVGKTNGQNTTNAMPNKHRILDEIDQYLATSIAAQSVTYTDTDLSSSLQLGTNQLFMKWQIYDNGTFEMAFDYNALNWLGIGFCPTMTDCDMIVLYVYQGAVLIIDTYSYSDTTPSTDKQQDINIQSYSVNSTGYKVRFQRKLNTGDSQDQVLAQNSTYTFCLAWSGATTMEMHDAWYNFDVDFNNNITGIAELYAGGDILYYVHAIVLFIAWGIVADFGIFIGRFFKTINSYLWIHAMSFLFVDLATIVMVILMLAVGGKGGAGGEEDAALNIHKVISLILLLLVIIQHIMGVVIKHFLETKGKENRQFVFTLRLIHAILGTLMFLAAKVDIITGFIRNEQKVLLVLAIIWTVLLIFVRIGLEVYKSMNAIINQKVAPQKQQILTEEQKKLMKLLQGNKTTNQIIQEMPDIKWVQFNQDVYDITDYQHPGGNFIITNVLGKEISRYFYGAFQLESTTMQSYTHSQQAYSALQKRYIGTIENPNCNYRDQSSPWQAEVVKLSKSISQFNFVNSSFSIKLRQNVEDFGQHFSISLQEVGGKVRMYTKILCMFKPYQEFREQFIKYHQNNQAPTPKLLCDETNTVPLIIKKYNFPNALSAQIFENPSQYWIQGPFGRGLEIGRSSKCVAFVGGTGLLPFLDLLDHLLMKSIYTVNKPRQNQIKDFFPQADQLNDDFEFTILASFQNEEEFIGREWIRTLFKINKENNLKFFDMKIRYSDSKLDTVIPIFHGRFTDEFVRSNLGDWTKNVYICGPPNMIYSLTQIISQTPQDSTKVMIV